MRVRSLLFLCDRLGAVAMGDNRISMNHSAESLRAFEQRVAEAYNEGRIRAPVHLAGGNEDQLLNIFKNVQPHDWVFCTWRSHYHALLKGVPEDVLFDAILAGRSIALCFPQYRIVSSAIVAGMVPVALGTAWAIKRQANIDADRPPNVWCFVGDMCARTGAFNEAREYAVNWDLPIIFVVEDNGKSVVTDTSKVWNLVPDGLGEAVYGDEPSQTIYYRYELPWPHAGAG